MTIARHPSALPATLDTGRPPLLFSPRQAAAAPPRAPRCPGIYMLAPDPPALTLGQLILQLDLQRTRGLTRLEAGR